MKESYGVNVTLKCATCGGTDLSANEDKSYVKCETCERKYFGGYDEVLEYNQKEIQTATEDMKKKITKDVSADFKKQLQAAFRGSKNIKIR